MRLVTGLRVGFTCAIELIDEMADWLQIDMLLFVFLLFKEVYGLDVCSIL